MCKYFNNPLDGLTPSFSLLSDFDAEVEDTNLHGCSQILLCVADENFVIPYTEEMHYTQL
jgi:hypothetical protein